MHPSDSASLSADVRGNHRRSWRADGRWDLWNYEKTEENGPKWKKPARGRNIDPISFSQLPRTSLGSRGMFGRKTEDRRGAIMRKQGNWAKLQKPGRSGRKLPPSASAWLRLVPRKPADVRCPKWKKPGRRGRNIPSSSVRSRQLRRAPVDVRDMCGRAMGSVQL